MLLYALGRSAAEHGKIQIPFSPEISAGFRALMMNASGSNPSRPRTTDTRPSSVTYNLLPAAIILHVTLVGVLCFVAFSRYSSLLFNGLDGASMLTNVRFQFAWTQPALGFFANPLQGLGDIWFNFNAWISPGFILPYFVVSDDVASPVFQASVYTVHAAILFLAIVVAARSFGFRWVSAFVGGWATILLLLPCFGASLVYPILQLQPNLAFTIAEAFIIIAAFSYLGRDYGSDSFLPSRHDIIIFLSLLALSGHFLLISPTGVILAVPFFLFVGVGLLIGTTTREELIKKMAAVLLIAGTLAAFGFAEFILGIFRFTAASFFASEFQNSRMTWFFASILFQEETFGPWGPILAIIGIAGLIHASLFAHQRLRWIARSILLFVLLNMIFGAVSTYYDFWKGPSPVYLEAMVWPLYATFGARLVFVSAARIWRSIRAKAMLTGVSSEPMLLSVSAAVPVAIILASFLFVAPETGQRSYIYPPSQPPIVRALEERIGLTRGGLIKGRVAVFLLRSNAKQKPVTWFDLHYADNLRMSEIGNDLHTIGLWYYGVPTLMEYAPTLSPPLFQAATRLLARPEDQQVRSVLVLRHINATALASFGVKFVITDAPAAAPLRPVLTERSRGSNLLHLYEVPSAIQDAASPTSVELVQSFDDALDRLSNPLFNPSNTAVVIAADKGDASFENLSPVRVANVRLARGGLDIELDSQGRSLAVVPMQFSRCTRFILDRPLTKPLKLIRVNALGTGILFEGSLRGKLEYFTGPFDRPGCRLEDAEEFSRVRRAH